jgi:hypothetical protein
VLRLLALSCAVAAAACRHDPGTRERLVDGSPAQAAPVELATIGDAAVVGKVEVVAGGRLSDGSAAASCLDELDADGRARRVVTRIGVDGESVSFRAASGRGLQACDGTDPRDLDHRWCGSAYGRLEAGRLTDPRLDLACTTTATGAPVAFAWVEPVPAARFVAVRQPGFVEAYEAAAGLPVRVTTTADVELEESSAAFEISEHDARGALLRSYRLTARVAG